MTCFLDFAANLVRNINAIWSDEVFPHNDILCALCISHLALILDRQPRSEDYVDLLTYFKRNSTVSAKNVLIDRPPQSSATTVWHIFFITLLRFRPSTRLVVFAVDKATYNRFIEYLGRWLDISMSVVATKIMYVGEQAKPPPDCDCVLVLKPLRLTRAWKQHVLDAPVPVTVIANGWDAELCDARNII